MRAFTNRRIRFVTSLSLQALEPRTPLAADFTTAAVQAAKVALTEAVATVHVQAVVTPQVAVVPDGLATAGEAATAAKEAARAAAVTAEAGVSRADVVRAGADTLAAFRETFAGVGRDTGSDRPTAGMFGPDLSVGDSSNVIAEWRDRYIGLIGGERSGGGETGSGGGEDVQAAAMAQKGMAAANDSCGKTPEERKKTYDKYEDELFAKRYEHRQMCTHDEKSGRPVNPKAHAAWSKEIDEAYSKADKCFDQVEKDKERAKKAEKEYPAPEGIGAQPHRVAPPLKSPPPRPGSATRPAVDGTFTVKRTPGVVRGQVTVNPAVDRGRDHVAPRVTLPRTPVTAAIARNVATVKVINWGNQR